MKKHAILLLFVLACIFAAGLVGFYVGRNISPAPVEVSALPRYTISQTPRTASTESIAPVQTTAPGPININTATSQELQTLPGIGPALAQRIIDFREENGPFETVSELTLVEGIGITTLEKLIDYVTTGGET